MRYNLTLSTDENDNITVVIKDNDSTNREEKVVGYLMIFRDYRIQISETPSGEWDLGSSRVLPYLSNIVSGMETETGRAFIQGLILEAIVNYQRSKYFEETTKHLGAAILPKLEDIRQLDKVATLFLGKLIGNPEISTYYC